MSVGRIPYAASVTCVDASEGEKLKPRRSENVHQAIVVTTYSAEIFSANHTNLSLIRPRKSRQVLVIRVRLMRVDWCTDAWGVSIRLGDDGRNTPLALNAATSVQSSPLPHQNLRARHSLPCNLERLGGEPVQVVKLSSVMRSCGKGIESRVLCFRSRGEDSVEIGRVFALSELRWAKRFGWRVCRGLTMEIGKEKWDVEIESIIRGWKMFRQEIAPVNSGDQDA